MPLRIASSRLRVDPKANGNEISTYCITQHLKVNGLAQSEQKNRPVSKVVTLLKDMKPLEMKKAVVIMCSQKVRARLCAVSRRRASPGQAGCCLGSAAD